MRGVKDLLAGWLEIPVQIWLVRQKLKYYQGYCVNIVILFQQEN